MTTSEEITNFLKILVMMRYHKLPKVRLYWSTDDDLHVENVSKIMPVLRLEKIKRFMHFTNNEEAAGKDDPSYDRAY